MKTSIDTVQTEINSASWECGALPWETTVQQSPATRRRAALEALAQYGATAVIVALAAVDVR